MRTCFVCLDESAGEPVVARGGGAPDHQLEAVGDLAQGLAGGCGDHEHQTVVAPAEEELAPALLRPHLEPLRQRRRADRTGGAEGHDAEEDHEVAGA